jgi:hypothetical protein
MSAFERFNLGVTTPYDEPCYQLGRPNCTKWSILEANQYIHQLQRIFKLPEGCAFRIMDNPHDFGTYKTVGIIYDPSNEEHINFIHQVDDEGPANWDAQAIENLKLADYPFSECV